MHNDKRRRLEAAGWKVEDRPQDFLGLSEREMCLVDMKVSLAIALRHRRAAANIALGIEPHEIGAALGWAELPATGELRGRAAG